MQRVAPHKLVASVDANGSGTSGDRTIVTDQGGIAAPSQPCTVSAGKFTAEMTAPVRGYQAENHVPLHTFPLDQCKQVLIASKNHLRQKFRPIFALLAEFFHRMTPGWMYFAKEFLGPVWTASTGVLSLDGRASGAGERITSSPSSMRMPSAASAGRGPPSTRTHSLG